MKLADEQLRIVYQTDTFFLDVAARATRFYATASADSPRLPLKAWSKHFQLLARLGKSRLRFHVIVPSGAVVHTIEMGPHVEAALGEAASRMAEVCDAAEWLLEQSGVTPPDVSIAELDAAAGDIGAAFVRLAHDSGPSPTFSTPAAPDGPAKLPLKLLLAGTFRLGETICGYAALLDYEGVFEAGQYVWSEVASRPVAVRRIEDNAEAENRFAEEQRLATGADGSALLEPVADFAGRASA